MKNKRAVTVLSVLLIVLTLLPSAVSAENTTVQDVSQYEVEDDSVEISDTAPDDAESIMVKGTLNFPALSMYSGDVLYTGKVVLDCGLRAQMSMESQRLISVPDNATIEILDIEPDWVLARYKGKQGYIKRMWIYSRPEAVNPVNTPPYGVYLFNYVATCAQDTPIQKAPGEGQEAFLTLHEGARISIIDVYEGWGRFYYHHTYGYVDMSKLRDLVNVSPTDTPIGENVPIAAYTSYYNIATTEANIGRMKNITVACERITRVYQPQETFDFNKQVGPYSRGNGYFPAPVLVNGTTVIGSGGGTCQVSSTQYNVLLQLPGISVLTRRAHQQSGAKYLPVGMDAAVGTDALNLRFINNYDFPIRMEATAQDGALTMVMYRAQ